VTIVNLAPFTAVAPSTGTLTPVSVADVTITGGFWADRQAVNATATLKHCLDWMERLGWIGNFDQVARGGNVEHAGREFSDSEIYKLLEALAWESARSGGEWSEVTFRELSARVVSAQQADGYVNTQFGNPGQAQRYSDLEWGHELYCAGHLIQAAVARARTAGTDAFVEAAIRLADHICDTFGPDGLQGIDGHPEIEPALVELFRVTGDRRYLDQARLFVERRGHGSLIGGETPAEYFQDDMPVRDADVLRGHAVRALYLAAGAVDVATEDGDDRLLEAVRAQWANTVARRTYVTGGMGARHEGESFGDDFELPSDRAYSETCAGVASIMLSWRLLLADGDTRYADLIERTLYNVVAASPDADGRSFFYVNPLQRNSPGVEPKPDEPSPRASSSQRAPWFEVSCCPTNVARTLASLSGYVATVDGSGLQVHQYIPSTIRTALPDGRQVAVSIATGYPFDGQVVVTVDEDSEEPWTLSLRVPAWAADTATAAIDGRPVAINGSTVSVTGAFTAGTRVELTLPVAPRITTPDRRIDSLRDSIAYEAGPLVLCAESLESAPFPIDRISVSPFLTPHAISEQEASGIAVVRGTVSAYPAASWPYESQRRRLEHRELDITLIPYYRWAEQGPSRMRVWLPSLPVEAELADVDYAVTEASEY
jgi:DUF1680 family protein